MSVVKGALFLAMTIVLAVAGGLVVQDQEVKLEGGRYNILNLACGPSPNTSGQYIYSYQGLPRWLNARGNQLFGTAPARQYGPWYATVNYWPVEDSTRKGSVRLVLKLREVRAVGSEVKVSSVLPATPKATVVPIVTKPLVVPTRIINPFIFSPSVKTTLIAPPTVKPTLLSPSIKISSSTSPAQAGSSIGKSITTSTKTEGTERKSDIKQKGQKKDDAKKST